MLQKTVLSNGVRVVTDTMPWTKSVSIGLWLAVGSRDEEPAEAGYAHMAEHMLFKGTPTRTARDIAEAMDRTGGHMNAFTTKETTCYHCRVPHGRMTFALELLADMLLHSNFAPRDLARERAVILEEINQVEDTPEDLAHEIFDRELFGDHPLAGSVLGTAASVAAAKREDLLRFVARHYRPSNLIVAVAGHVAHDEAVRSAASLFGRWSGAEAGETAGPRRLFPRLAYEPKRTLMDKEGEQVHLVVGAPGLKRGDGDRYALDLLDMILGGGMSSRLFQELREERGLVYSAYSFHAEYADAGVVGGYAATGPQRAAEALELMEGVFEAVRRDGVTEAEVARAKEQVKGGLLLGWENTGTRMGVLAAAELAGEPYLDADALSARYDEVTVEDVGRVAARLLAPEKLSVVALGPGADRPRSRAVMEAIG